MPDASDMELLREYDQHASEEAFATLVQRHVNLVHSAALRHVGIPAHAEEITQAVFVILARKGARLRPDTILEGWLYETTRLASLSFRRGERRRQFREQEAYMQSMLQESAADPAWNQIAPLLDEAMSRLGKQDRDAVMLRYFKGKNVREVAAALRVNEAAAQRRILRAVEKLRRHFTRRGVVVPAAVLTAVISENSVRAAPAVLAKAATALAVTKGAAASGSTSTLIKGALKIMAWTKAKMAVVVGVGVLLAAGATTTAVVTVARMEARNYTIAREPWSDLGASTPKAAVQTLAWAVANDKRDRVEALMQWEETGQRDGKSAAFEHEVTVVMVMSQGVKEMESFRVVSIVPSGQPDEVRMTIQKVYKDSRFGPFELTLRVKHVGREWHVVGKLEYHDNTVGSSWLPFMASF